MKKVVSFILVLALALGCVPVFAKNPYTIISEFSDQEETGVIVKKNDDFDGDFTLYAAYADDEHVYAVKRIESSKLLSGREISFDTIDGAEIKFFTWNKNLAPVENDFSALNYTNVMSKLKLANDYWIGQNRNVEAVSNPWQVSVFLNGNMQAYYMTGDELYRNYAEKWANASSWQSYGYPVWDTTNADNICCFRTYLDLYNIDKENANIDYVKNQVDRIVNSSSINFWDWIDAFYMAGPVFTKMYELTGEEKYLDKMYQMIKYTAEDLNCYDEESGLWFRDAYFVGKTSDNGEKVFWSRGNGWVYAAFAQIIEELPDSYKHKDYFVNIFVEMSAALKRAQCENGAWHESLLDIDYNPDCEESGTGFFVYGILWGINNGYLNENEYFLNAAMGWQWLTEAALQTDGRIGYVQHIGAQPTKDRLYSTSTQHYAYANFVYAASEMAKYLGGMQGDVVPYLKKKLLGNIAIYKDGANYAIKNGEIVSDSINCEEIVVPDGMYLYRYEDLYIVSEFIAPFNRTETNLLNMLSSILDTGKFPERAYSDPDRIPITGGGEIISPGSDKIEIKISDITVSQIPEIDNGPVNMIDGKLQTRWAAEVTDKNDPCRAVFDLGQVYNLNKIGLAFNRGAERTTEFAVMVSEDGEEYTEVIARGNSSGTTENVEYYELNGVKARFVKLLGYGNSSPYTNIKNWFSPTEVEFYKTGEGSGDDNPVTPDDPGKEYNDKEFDMMNASLTASIVTEPENGVENLRDGNFETYCVLYVKDQNNPEYIQINLCDVYSVSRVGLAFRWGTTRSFDFDIRISKDGNNYETVVPRRASDMSVGPYEYFEINKDAKFIRIYGYSNTFNINWVSITEAKVYTNE